MRYIIPIVLISCVCFLNGCGSGSTTQNQQTAVQNSVNVSIVDFAFNPQNLIVNSGTTVKWTNNGSTGHTTTSGQPCIANGVWDSGSLSQGASFSRAFQNTGTFSYYCIPHCGGGMTGVVTVQ